MTVMNCESSFKTWRFGKPMNRGFSHMISVCMFLLLFICDNTLEVPTILNLQLLYRDARSDLARSR